MVILNAFKTKHSKMYLNKLKEKDIEVVKNLSHLKEIFGEECVNSVLEKLTIKQIQNIKKHSLDVYKELPEKVTDKLEKYKQSKSNANLNRKLSNSSSPFVRSFINYLERNKKKYNKTNIMELRKFISDTEVTIHLHTLYQLGNNYVKNLIYEYIESIQIGRMINNYPTFKDEKWKKDREFIENFYNKIQKEKGKYVSYHGSSLPPPSPQKQYSRTVPPPPPKRKSSYEKPPPPPKKQKIRRTEKEDDFVSSLLL